MRHWYRTFFTETALDVWQTSRSDELTTKEVDYLQRSLELNAPSRLLDLACGNGRHAVALASRGFSVTGVDIAAGNSDRAKARATAHDVKIDIVIADMSEMSLARAFDGAYCWGNSLGYFPRSAMNNFLHGVANALSPGARFVVDTATTAESILRDVNRRSWFQVSEELLLLLDSSYDPRESRLDTTYTTIKSGQIVDKSTAHVWVFTIGELIALARNAGFEALELHSDLNGSSFTLGDERLLLVLQKQ